MSSLIRRLEISFMKRAGYTREKWIIDRRGKPVPVKRDGEITDPDDTPIGRDWSVRVPTRARPEANRRYPSVISPFVPRALRRSKRSQQWLEARAKARREQSL